MYMQPEYIEALVQCIEIERARLHARIDKIFVPNFDPVKTVKKWMEAKGGNYDCRRTHKKASNL